MILLPLLCLHILTCALRFRFALSWPRCLLIAWITVSLFILVATELLSNYFLLNSHWVFCLWYIFFGACLTYLALSLPKFFASSRVTQWPHLSILEIFLLCAFGLIAIATGITSYLSAVNSHDALNYHIPKVIYWLQQGSLNIFPTFLDTHNVYAPFSEYMLLHIYLLSMNNDQFMNLLQYSSMIISLVGLSLIAKELALSRFGQILTVLFGITLPLGLMEASTVQNDYVGAMWAVLFIYFLICYKSKGLLIDLLFMSVSFGLGLLTKGTNYILMVPLGLILWIGFKPRLRLKIAHAFLFFLIVVTINAGYLSRLHGVDRLQNPPATSLMNKDFSPSNLASNMIRYSTMHLSSPWEDANTSIDTTIRTFCSWVGIDLYKNPSPANHFFRIRPLTTNEDTVTNGFHFLLLLGLTCYGLFGVKGPWRVYTLGLVCSWIVFCVLLKWQWWGSRFHLGWFLLFAPLFGLYFQNKRVVSFILSLILLTTSFWFITSAQKRPWFSYPSIFKSYRPDLLFIYSPELKNNCQAITDEMTHNTCRDIGLLFNRRNVLEYLILRPLLASGHSYRFQHISPNTPLSGFVPCYILCVSCPESTLHYEGHTYSQSINGYFQLFKKE